MTREQMGTLIDAHFSAEEKGDLQAIVDGFTTDAEHDVAGRPGGPIHGGESIAAFTDCSRGQYPVFVRVEAEAEMCARYPWLRRDRAP